MKFLFVLINDNRQQDFSNDMIYSKLSDEKGDPVPEDTVDSFQVEKEALWSATMNRTSSF